MTEEDKALLAKAQRLEEIAKAARPTALPIVPREPDHLVRPVYNHQRPLHKPFGPVDDRHVRFVEEYIGSGFVLKKAAEATGMSIGRARTLMGREEIQEAIRYRKWQIAERCGITAERIMREYALIAFANLIDFVKDFNEDGVTYKDLEELFADPDVKPHLAAISKIVATPGKDGQPGTIRIELHSKLEALNQLSKILELFEKDDKKDGMDSAVEGQRSGNTEAIIGRLARIAAALPAAGDTVTTNS